jgi:hypothetical protein
MKILKYIIIISLATTIQPIFAQCITSMDEVLDLIPDDSDPGLILKENFTPKSFNLAFYITSNKKRIPVLDQNQIPDIVSNLNQDFESTSISFYSSNTKFIDDYNYRMIDSLLELSELPKFFGTPESINIFIVDSIVYDIQAHVMVDTVIYDTSFIHSYVPKILSENNRDYVFITPQYLYNSEFVHQLAHLFGLLHTNETKTGYEYVNGSNCETAGDKICDTPADGIGTDAYGRSYIPIPGNYMSSNPSGACHFTPRQIKRMHYFINKYKTYLK